MYCCTVYIYCICANIYTVYENENEKSAYSVFRN